MANPIKKIFKFKKHLKNLKKSNKLLVNIWTLLIKLL